MYNDRNELLEDPIFIEYSNIRNISSSTKASQATSLLRYCKYHNKTLKELYDEADKEEEERIRAKKRKIWKKIIEYRQNMITEKFSTNTIKGALTVIKTFYRTMGIEIPYIPPAVLPHKQLLYDDIPNKEHIKQAIESTNSRLHKAIILFQYSSCTALAETLSITCEMFVEATKEYHEETDINKVIPILKKQKNVVPFFLLSRQKRRNIIEDGYKYYTCCTPEATRYILTYLEERINKKGELENEDKLFKIGEYGVSSAYLRINDKNNWPKKGKSRFFRSHTMRIAGSTAIGDEAIGDLFSGRKRTPIYEGYYKRNPKKIKQLYLKYINDLSIEKTKVNFLDDETARRLKEEHRKEINALNEKMEKVNDRLEKHEKVIKREEEWEEWNDFVELSYQSKIIKKIMEYVFDKYGSEYIRDINFVRKITELSDKNDLNTMNQKECEKEVDKIVDGIQPVNIEDFINIPNHKD